MTQVVAKGLEGLYETARALGEETRFRIYRHVALSGDPVSVSEMAEAFDLHPNAIRQHLARLEQAGLIVSTSDRSNGAGRPRRLFALSPEPFEFSHPTRSLRPLVAMLADVVDGLPADRRRLLSFGRTWGRTWATGRRRENGAVPRSRRGRAEYLAAVLAEWGWQPATRREEGRYLVATGRCLFHDLSSEGNGRCCALEEGLLTGLVETLLNGRSRVRRSKGCRLEVSL